jgi:hypothetical protein
MGDVLVKAASRDGNHLTKAKVTLHGIGDRVIDRAAVVSWMRDGHSFIPMVGGVKGAAWQLVELEGDEPRFAIRADNQGVDADEVGDLPAV